MQQRPLGVWESGFRSAHDMLAGTMLVVSRTNILGCYEIEKIKHAFKLLFDQHPLLRATIETRGYNSYFILNAVFENIPFEEKNHILPWEKQFELEIHQPLKTEYYLWRITIVKTNTGFELFIITHHAIADALSVISLLEQFMKLYSELLQNKIPSLSSLTLLNNVEYYLKENSSWEEFIKNYQELNQKDITQIPFEKNAPLYERHSKSEFLIIEKQQLSKLLEKCKIHRVTLNSLLNAVMLITQATLNPDYDNASLKTPVNLRQYANPPIEQKNIGCFLSIVETIHLTINTKKNIWVLAATFQEQLHRAISKIGFLPKMIDYAEIDISFLTQLFGVSGAKRRVVLPNTFGVSNIGRLEIQTDYPQFKLMDFVFSTNHLVGNYYIFLSALTLLDQLQLIFSYVTPLISEIKAQQFIKTYIEILQSIYTLRT